MNRPQPTDIALNYTVRGLSKLLVFNAFAGAQSNNAIQYVAEEARKYPYPIRDDLEKVRKTLFENSNSYIFLPV